MPATPTLPVIQPRGLRPRRPSLWRTLTLIAVHVVIIVHVAHWFLAGVTVSPLEPSEGMEFARHGVVNTGLVFFAATILVTAVFGRFFCGWGCHLVALQDLSRWVLIKLGLRPRPLRSRLLGLVPPIAFLYMFLWPAVYKVAAGRELGPVRSGFLTSDFWATFPGLGVAVATFLVCGFVVVFILGSKGYCSYGCPYGAAFGLADRLAPVRIRVTDACQHCATCTSVCTSNVRVHEEVRTHGMVVDAGCMKCLDCVAHCPNQALYVGAGRPAVGKAPSRRGPGSLRASEELLAGAVFIVAFAVFRGLYSLVPFLFSLGIGAAAAGLAVAGKRFLVRPDARLGPVRLKASGRVRPAGWVFTGAAAVLVLVWVHSASVQVVDRTARTRFAETGELRRAALDLDAPAPALGGPDRELVTGARATERLLYRISAVDTAEAGYRRAWLAFLDGDGARAEQLVDESLRRWPGHAGCHLLAARLLAGEGRWPAAEAAYRRAVELAPDDAAAYLGLGTVLGRSGRVEEALAVFRRGLELNPLSVDLRYNLGLASALTGGVDAAIGHFEAVLASAPDHRPARENLAGLLAASGRFADAVAIYEEAVRRAPEDAGLRVMAARACLGAGDRERAAEHVEAAVAIDPAMGWARGLLE